MKYFRHVLTIVMLASILGALFQSSLNVRAVQSLQSSNILSEQLAELRDRIKISITSQLITRPDGIRLLDLQLDGLNLVLNLSTEARSLVNTIAFEELIISIDQEVNEVLAEEGWAEQRTLDYTILIDGQPLFEPQPPLNGLEAAAYSPGSVQGKKIVLSPGHGWHATSSGGWSLDRVYYWGIVEDFINAELVMELNNKLASAGADRRPARELNKSVGNHSSSHPWWEMGSSEYVRSLGAPGEVWGSSFIGKDRNIVAPPEYANWIGADALISIHNNGGRGCGTETWYDTQNGHQTNSQRLANLIQTKLIERLRAQWDANWCNRGVKGSNGGYGENRRFRGPAVIVELAFMDTQSNNDALKNATFRTIAMSAINDAIVEYFGGSSDSDGGNLNYGQTVNGAINPSGDTDEFFFNASANDIVEIRLNQNSSSLDPVVVLYGSDGRYITENDDSAGTRNSFLRLTLNASGQYKIVAKGYSTSTGAYSLNLTKTTDCGGDCEGENRWISLEQTLNGTINPNNDRDTYLFSGTAGRVVSIRMNRTGGNLDSFIELWGPNGVMLKDNDDGGGDQNSWLAHTLPVNGTYRISAYSFSNDSSGTYSIELKSVTGGGGSGNLARGKSVNVSSVEAASLPGWRATDGDNNTRWSSQFSDPQWIYVDLGQNRTINQVVLKWETAYARRFGIYIQPTGVCSNCWTNVYWTDNGGGGTNTINFNPVQVRYVLMYGIQRGTPWGYSLWEFEVYDTTNTPLPEVPPDEPGKGENTAPLAEPLAPVEGDKEVVLNGNGAYAQEATPLASGDAVTVTEQISDIQPIVAFINSPNDYDSADRWDVPPGYIYFEGQASSQEPTVITAYLWRSDRNGEIGVQATFTLPLTSLLPGLHTIYFSAQNNQGQWSEEASTTVNIIWPNQVFLPVISR